MKMTTQAYLLREAKPLLRCHGCHRFLESGETVLAHLTNMRVASRDANGSDVALQSHVSIYCVSCIEENARAFTDIHNKIEHDRMGLKEEEQVRLYRPLEENAPE